MVADGVRHTDDTGVEYLEVQREQVVYAQHAHLTSVNRPAWFVGPALACAYALRNSDSAPFAFATARTCKVVDLSCFGTVAHMLRTLTSDRLRAAATFATGMGASREHQQRVLRRFVGAPSSLRPCFFVDRNDRIVRAPRIFVGDTCFGASDTNFNRVAIPKVEFVLAEAVAHAFPWADGYTSSACASTWHRHQLYPSELCLLRPGTVLVPLGVMTDYDDIRTASEWGVLEAASVHVKADARIGRAPPRVVPDAAPLRVDDDVSLGADVESSTCALTLDNPLVNNDVQ